MTEPVFGFYGKIPARGDFVRLGLPRGFIDPWDAWLQAMLAVARQHLGPRFEPAWMEAPIWRFQLAADLCGPDAAIGVMMPSVDRVGRLFPLTLAHLAPGVAPADWLDRASAAGLAALDEDLDPPALLARLEQPMPDPAASPPRPLGRAAGMWWTSGAPLVPAGHFATRSLPDAARFLRMLDATDPR